MIQLQGYWYNGESSNRSAATLWLDEVGELIIYDDGNKSTLYKGSFAGCQVSSRLGNTPRYISFASGEKFETSDNDSVDKIQSKFDDGFLSGVIHKLESHFHFVLLTLVLVIGFGWGMVTYGVPGAAKVVANLLPHKVLEFATEQTMYTLDKGLFEESQLPDDVKHRVLQHFQSAIDQHPDLHLNVEFRDGGKIGANAFALPDGTIVFTDQMVKLARSDDELLAVFAHEIGHVEHRHGMRSVVQDSLLAFLLLMITGDTSATAEIFLALPIIMTELAYSRDFERQSDDYALQYMQTHRMDPSHFPNLMRRLEKQDRCYQKVTTEILKNAGKKDEVVVVVDTRSDDTRSDDTRGDDTTSDNASSDEISEQKIQEAVRQARLEYCSPEALDTMSDSQDAERDGLDFSNYLSTHPSTEERLRRFQ